tara:strand:+ start:406 stop:633 length:228 start_codon:yes stop_codon:yes gene_type:complete
MQRNLFHNTQPIREATINKIKFQTQQLDKKIVVDINKLLNRVKKEKKIEMKKQIIFYSSSILALCLFSTFIAIIK